MFQQQDGTVALVTKLVSYTHTIKHLECIQNANSVQNEHFDN